MQYAYKMDYEAVPANAQLGPTLTVGNVIDGNVIRVAVNFHFYSQDSKEAALEARLVAVDSSQVQVMTGRGALLVKTATDQQMVSLVALFKVTLPSKTPIASVDFKLQTFGVTAGSGVVDSFYIEGGVVNLLEA